MLELQLEKTSRTSFDVSYTSGLDKRELRRVKLVLGRTSLELDERVKIPLEEITAVSYPNSNVLALMTRDGLDLQLIFSTNPERVTFERLAWINWKLIALDREEKFFAKENFKERKPESQLDLPYKPLAIGLSKLLTE